MRSRHSREAPTRRLQQRKFFNDVEDAIVDRLHAEAHSEGARDDLARQTGISDASLLSELTELGFTTRTLIALRLIPLVLVAWADHRVDSGERQAVLDAASTLGIRPESEAYMMLDHWLREVPPRESVDAWKRYMRDAMGRLSQRARAKLATFFRTQMTAIAKASGGQFGFGKVSGKERQVIDGFMNTLCH
ncbi:hypothetical protein [Stieleria sp.]|uniref:hypothetical protein n=1 Tax=Stieleria sp. TaxID=2795976 RepID=UPI0035613B2B